jgi:SAM-dependent methyltransferase
MQSQNAEYAAQYGESCVEFYDQLYRDVDPNLINRLCELSAGGRVLELGIGTGRIGLPLAARGIDISGIEGSPSMLARLRAKPGGARLQVVRGNFADVEMDGPFSLIFAVVSTFYLLRSHEEQQRCFNKVAGLLTDYGIFVLENFEPLGAVPISDDEQLRGKFYLSKQIVETLDGPREYCVRLCYAAPQQLDEMARKAGLCLRERWSNWQCKPYTPSDHMHVSVYVRA